MRTYSNLRVRHSIKVRYVRSKVPWPPDRMDCRKRQLHRGSVNMVSDMHSQQPRCRAAIVMPVRGQN